MNYVNWYRIARPFDNYTARDVGRIVRAEGTIRMAALEQMGLVEQVSELGSKLMTGPAKVNAEPPRGTTVRRKRRGTVEAEPVGGADVREEPGDTARGEDGPADRDGVETAGSDAEAGPAA